MKVTLVCFLLAFLCAPLILAQGESTTILASSTTSESSSGIPSTTISSTPEIIPSSEASTGATESTTGFSSTHEPLKTTTDSPKTESTTEPSTTPEAATTPKQTTASETTTPEPTTPDATTPATTPETSTQHETTVEPTTQETTTVEPTTEPPIPTPTPGPVADHWSLRFSDSDNYCLLLTMSFSLDIEDSTTNQTINVKPAIITVNNKTSSCNNTEGLQVLTLDFDLKNSLELTFNKTDTSVFIQDMKIKININDTTDTATLNTKEIFSVGPKLTYFCASEQSETLNGTKTIMTIKMVDMKYLAFIDHENDKYSQFSVCDADTKVADIVPIAVGVALAILVLIVLVAYVIGRRRSRQKGYQSV